MPYINAQDLIANASDLRFFAALMIFLVKNRALKRWFFKDST